MIAFTLTSSPKSRHKSELHREIQIILLSKHQGEVEITLCSFPGCKDSRLKVFPVICTVIHPFPCQIKEQQPFLTMINARDEKRRAEAPRVRQHQLHLHQ